MFWTTVSIVSFAVYAVSTNKKAREGISKWAKNRFKKKKRDTKK